MESRLGGAACLSASTDGELFRGPGSGRAGSALCGWINVTLDSRELTLLIARHGMGVGLGPSCKEFVLLDFYKKMKTAIPSCKCKKIID
jgi:hypothetical protein